MKSPPKKKEANKLMKAKIQNQPDESLNRKLSAKKEESGLRVVLHRIEIKKTHSLSVVLIFKSKFVDGIHCVFMQVCCIFGGFQTIEKSSIFVYTEMLPNVVKALL